MDFEVNRVSEILGFAEAALAWPEPSAGARRPVQLASVEDAVRAGLPKAALFNVARLIEGDAGRASELAYSVVPKSSLARRETLTPEQSEKTERLARLFALAESVLGGQDEARDFLHRPHPELEGRRPLDAAATELGGRGVEKILYSVEYGLPV
jgi:putative toxin-antitoxin system antitoxin component (TIGR02293 family)